MVGSCIRKIRKILQITNIYLNNTDRCSSLLQKQIFLKSPYVCSTNLLVLLAVEADTGKVLHLDISLLQQARSQLVLLPPEFCRVN